MEYQNIFDNQEFFDGYKELRAREVNANSLFEIPVLFSMLPDLNDKSVLDLGCGFGEHCVTYVEKGACSVIGVDISENMLEVARRENADPAITYLNMPMEDIDKLDGPFDVVISSLAFHYVRDFDSLVRKISDLMNPGGIFLFSQENPINTTHGGGDRWTRDKDGNKLYANLKDYSVEGERESKWFVEGVKKYHRKFSTIVNALADSGFTIEHMVEPAPDEELLRKYPDYADLKHKPDFLIVRARKL